MAFRWGGGYRAPSRSQRDRVMRTKTPSFLAVACLAVVSPFLTAQEGMPVKPPAVDAAAPKAQANAPLVGIVDLAKAIEQYPKWIELQAKLDTLEGQVRERMKQMDTRVDDLRNAVQITSPESDERKRAQFELELAQQERQFVAKSMYEKVDLEQQRALLAVYEDLEKAVPAVAKARGVSVVLRVLQSPKLPADVPPQSPRGVGIRLRAHEGRQVWYADAELDLTPDLIKYLMVPREAKPADGSSANGAPAGSGKPAPAGGSKEGGN